MSRISDDKSEDILIYDYFPYDMLVAFSRVEASCYAHITNFLEEGGYGIKKELEEAAVVAKSVVPWYANWT